MPTNRKNSESRNKKLVKPTSQKPRAGLITSTSLSRLRKSNTSFVSTPSDKTDATPKR